MKRRQCLAFWLLAAFNVTMWLVVIPLIALGGL